MKIQRIILYSLAAAGVLATIWYFSKKGNKQILGEGGTPGNQPVPPVVPVATPAVVTTVTPPTGNISPNPVIAGAV